MGMYQVAITFQGDSGAPTDRYVNNFHFDFVVGEPDPETELTDIVQHVIDAYTTVLPGNTYKMSAFFSTAVAQNGHVCKVYDAEAAPPRLPLITTPFDLVAAPTADGLPEEVALVLSMRGDLVPGTNVGPGVHAPARHRNRIYFGPVNVDNSETVSGQTRPTLEFREHLLNMAVGLAATPIGWNWSIWSPTRAAGEPVQLAWVDNAWDTQRRRGPSATSRMSETISA